MKAALLFFALFFFQNPVFSQVYPDSDIDFTLRSGINYIILQNYSEAERIFIKLDKSFPHLPLGKIYLAAVEIAKSYDYGESYNELFIDSLLILAKDQSRRLEDKDNNNIWYKYFLSLSEGYLAYFRALNGNWLNSLSEGINALSDFEDLTALDRNFYDAFIAIGTFKYWKSRKTEFFSWVPGYDDEKEEGIALLEEAVNHASYNTYLAINSLIWIYIDQKKYIKALNLANDVLKKYPGSRFFMWDLARAYEETDPEKAIGEYTGILNSFTGKTNHYNEIVLKHLIAQQYVRIGKKAEAIKICEEILSITNLKEEVRARLENRLKRVEELKMELSR